MKIVIVLCMMIMLTGCYKNHETLFPNEPIVPLDTTTEITYDTITVYSTTEETPIISTVSLGETLNKEQYYDFAIPKLLKNCVTITRGNSRYPAGVYQHIDNNEYECHIEMHDNDNPVTLLGRYKSTSKYLSGVNYKRLYRNGKFYIDAYYKINTDSLSGVSATITKHILLKYNVRNSQQKVQYTGNRNGILHFMYTEYINDMIKPGFSLEVTLDSRNSNLLIIKNCKIEIISASGSEITYKVIQNFK